MKTKNLLKKAFLLLALIGGASNAWGDPVFGEANSICLDISKYATISTVGGYSSYMTNLSAYDSENNILVVNGYGAISSRGSQKWVTVAESGSAGRSAWDATGIFKGTTYYDYQSSGMSGSNYRVNALNSGRTTIFEITNCTKVSALVKSGGTGSGRYVVMKAYLMNAEGTEKASETPAFTQNGTNSNQMETITIDGLNTSNVYKIELTGNDSNNSDFYEIAFYTPDPSPASVPTITTDLSATADVTVGEENTFSIVATDAVSYQWYVGGEAVVGATSDSYSYTAGAAGDVEIYCNAINAAGTTKSTVCTVTATMPASAPTITTDLEAAYNVQKGKTQVLTIVADGASSYQWYKDGEAIGGATSTSYTYTAGSTIGATNNIYCKATNAAGSVNSTTATMTVVGSNACELTNVKFSNGAWGAINSGAYGDKTIAVPYMAGTSAPTVDESSIVISDGATYSLSLDGNTLTVTAEDGTTNKAFSITKVAVTPLSVSADVATTNFSDVPSWVFNLYGYDDSKGLKFAKAVNDATMRIALGNTRQYYFIGAAKSLTLTKKDGTTTRKVNVYVNGTKVKSDTNNDALGTIALNESASNLVIIESAQTGGDGGFESYAIEGSENVSKTISAAGWATYCSPYALDLEHATGLTDAYIVTGATGNVLNTTSVKGGTIPANTGILIEAPEGTVTIPVVANSSTDVSDNKFQGVTTATEIAANDGYVLMADPSLGFYKNANAFTVGANTAYLPANFAGSARSAFFFGGNITAVDNVEAAAKVKALPVKRIVNGKLVIENEGDIFNAFGQKLSK